MRTPDSSTTFVVRATRELYDRQATEYARATDDFARFPGLRDELDRFIERADTSRPLLDLGCGAGRDAAYLAGRGCTVVAADLSHRMLCLTRERWAGLPSGWPVQLSMLDLPFGPNVFGGVWACASLLHVPRDGVCRALAEVFRVLARSGAVAIGMKAGCGEGWHAGTSLAAQRWFTFVDPEAFAADLRTAGFVRVTCTFSGRRNWLVAEADLLYPAITQAAG